MRRLILVPLLIIVAVLAIAGGVGWWLYNNYMYYSTDDAQVNGQIINVSSPANGTLSALNVKQGDTITQDQSLGTVTVAPSAGANAASSSAPSINISSPINGKVLQVAAVQGQGVAAGLTLLQVTDLSNVNIIAYVDESAINNVQVGQQADVTIDAYSSTSFSGHVQQIIPAAASEFSLLPTQDYASGNFTKVGQRIPVIITLDGNAGKTLAPGMSASVTIHIH